MTDTTLDRRRFVQAATGVAITGVLAGCAGDDDGNGGGGNGGGGNGGGGNGDGDGNGGGGYLDDEPDYDGWFDDVDNYDGTVDETGSDTVTVAVGSGGGLQYSPAAVAVSTGTTVTWEWTGEGGQHDVTASDGEFESALTDEAGHEFTHTFEDAGVYTYVCTPHEAVNMKGAIVVR